MQVETFEGIENPLTFQGQKASDFDELETYVTIQDLRARIVISVKLGLKSQTEALVAYYKAYSLKSAIPYPFLYKEKEAVLGRIFPTMYKNKPSSSDLRDGWRDLAAYNYDLIPTLALQAWNQSVERGHFTEYEIWTAEQRRRPDPVLIGRRYEHPFIYLIARWGDAIRKWEELEKEVARHGR